MFKKEDFVLLIGGEAGQGTRFGGNLISQVFNQLGYFIYVYEDYQSLIRGGHNFSEVRLSKAKREARKKEIDVILALDQKTIDLHKERLKKEGFLIFNNDRAKSEQGIGVPVEKIVKEEGGSGPMVNTALISAFLRIFNIDFSLWEKILRAKVKNDIDVNLKIAKRIFEIFEPKFQILKIQEKESLLMTGNEACALGMIKAGLDFYFAYPMTPSTSILVFLANKEKEFNVRTYQPESEISVINMALGAAFAGKKTAVGTSGGGFALMTEALSLASQSETPILIINSQRAGPSTGMPTYNLQGDLNFILGAGHGDMEKIVLHAGNAKDALFCANLGLNLAWQYQTPVILLLDKDVSENTFSVEKEILEDLKSKEPKLFEKKEGENFSRYQLTPDGISPLAFPGGKFIVKANSYEHDEFGITNDEEEIVKKMIEKRKRKFETIKRELQDSSYLEFFGPKDAEIFLFPFGINKGIVLELAERMGFSVIFPYLLSPFPEEIVKSYLKKAKKIFTIELNSLGQYAQFLKRYGIFAKPILKYTGRPFFIEELEEEIKKEI